MVDVKALLVDLAAEQADLYELLVAVGRDGWDRPTAAPGWTIGHQVAHLAYFDQALVVSVSDPEAFARVRAQADADPAFGEKVLIPLLDQGRDGLLETWQRTSVESRAALQHVQPGARIPWFGPAMSVASKVTARLMETWAHGQDVADACGVERPATDRLRHVADLAVRARPYSYAVRGRVAPDADLGVGLVGPSGEMWRFLDPDGTDVVSGDALDFCLVMTRRRHVDDTALVATSGVAREWLEIGQAYAGEPGEGRSPGQFPRRREVTGMSEKMSAPAGRRREG